MRELCEWRAFLTVERSGAITQKAVDLDSKIKDTFAPLMGLIGKPSNANG